MADRIKRGLIYFGLSLGIAVVAAALWMLLVRVPGWPFSGAGIVVGVYVGTVFLVKKLKQVRLRRELHRAIRQEDYERAAVLRDIISKFSRRREKKKSLKE